MHTAPVLSVSVVSLFADGRNLLNGCGLWPCLVSAERSCRDSQRCRCASRCHFTAELHHGGWLLFAFYLIWSEKIKWMYMQVIGCGHDCWSFSLL